MIQETLTLFIISVACINIVTSEGELTPSVEYTEKIFTLFPSCHHHIVLNTKITFGLFLSPKRIFSCPAYLQKDYLHNKTLTDKDILTSCKRFDLKDSLLNFFHWSSFRSIAAGGCQTFFVFMKRTIPNLSYEPRPAERRKMVKFQGIQSNSYFLLVFTPIAVRKKSNKPLPLLPLPLMTPNVFYVLSLTRNTQAKKPSNIISYIPYRLFLFCLECWHGNRKAVDVFVAEFFFHPGKDVKIVWKNTTLDQQQVQIYLKLELFLVSCTPKIIYNFCCA